MHLVLGIGVVGFAVVVSMVVVVTIIVFMPMVAIVVMTSMRHEVIWEPLARGRVRDPGHVHVSRFDIEFAQ